MQVSCEDLHCSLYARNVICHTEAVVFPQESLIISWN